MTDDFQIPQRTGPQQMRWLRILHEGVARDFGAALSASLRTRVEVSLADLDRRTYGEFLDSLDTPACCYVLKSAPVEDRLLLDIQPSILYSLIDYLLGGGVGKGDRSNLCEAPSGPFRQIGPIPFSYPLSEIELRLTARIVHLFLEDICRAWKEVVDLKLDVLQVEGNPRQLRVLPADEAVVQVGFELAIGHERGMIRLCLPCRAISRMSGGKGDGANLCDDQRCASVPASGPSRQIGPVPFSAAPVELSVTLAETEIAGHELADLRPGDIITTETAADSPAIVSIEGHARFRAKPAVYQGRKAICITEAIEAPAPPE